MKISINNMGIRRAWSVALTVIGVAALLGTPASAQSPLKINSLAPQFRTHITNGKPLTLRSLRGHVVLIDFWATWCVPCRMSTPMLQGLHSKFAPKGLKVVGLSLDEADTRDHIGAYRNHYGVTYSLAYDPKANYKTSFAYHINKDPNTGKVYPNPVPPAVFLIDKRGRVRYGTIGYYEAEEKELTPLIQKLLAE